MQQLHNFKYMSSAAPLMIFSLTFRNYFPWVEPTVLCLGHFKHIWITSNSGEL